MTVPKRVPSLVTIAAAACLAGCLSGRSPAARFFQLQPAADLAAAAGAPLDTRRAIVLRRVTLDAYLNRQQMARRLAPYEVTYLELARWAEPLDRNATRVLAENLRRLLQTEQVAVYPQAASALDSVVVDVDIGRFEAKPGDQGVLSAAWTVRLGTADPGVRHARELHAPVSGDSIEDAVAVQSGLLAELSRLIAADVLALAPAPQQ
ncbi:MAG: PqiC family protein [Kiritimatiellae bacterium]|nr:PqiC family protein [Kiritimatiellia bacterium]